MGLLARIQAAFGAGAPAGEAERRQAQFAQDLRRAICIVGDFGAVLEHYHPEDGLGPLQSEHHLPHPREAIMQAIARLQAALASPEARAMAIRSLSPEKAEYTLSHGFAQALESGRVLLDCFVPEEALQKQREASALVAEAQKRYSGVKP